MHCHYTTDPVPYLRMYDMVEMLRVVCILAHVTDAASFVKL